MRTDHHHAKFRSAKSHKNSKQSEELYRRLIQSVQDYAIFSLDTEGRVSSWNLGAQRIKQYLASEIIGQHFSKFYTAEDLKAEKPSYELREAVLRGRFEDEGWRVRKDGSRFWANVIITPIWGEDHHLSGFSKVTRDMTEKKRNEDLLRNLNESLERRVAERTQQLSEVEERYNQAMNAAGVGVWEWSFASDHVYWNGKNAELYDLDVPSNMQADLEFILDRIHPDYRSEVRRELHLAVTEHREMRKEFRVLTRDGSSRWLLAVGKAEYDKNGKPLRMFGINTDITARKLAEINQAEIQQKLQESEDKFRWVANSIPQMAWMTKADGWITWYNERWYEYTGTTLKEMQGWGWEKVHHPDYTKSVTEKWLKHLESGEEWEDTFPLRSKEGNYRWFLSRALPARDSQGKILRWFGTNTDITELREAIRARDTFLSIASHELKTPLTSLHLSNQLRLRNLRKGNLDVLNPEKTEAFLHSQSEFIKRLTLLVEDLLDVSRISEGNFRLKVEKIDLCPWVNDLIDRFRITVDAAQVKIVLDLCDSVEGMWDRLRLDQVLLNLLTNALRYGLKKPIHVQVTSNSTHAFIRVKDSGIGIKPEDQQRIFNRYERAISEDEVSGMGLGLYISNVIVQAHGGKIEIKSQLGEGTEVTVIIPKGL